VKPMLRLHSADVVPQAGSCTLWNANGASMGSIYGTFISTVYLICQLLVLPFSLTISFFDLTSLIHEGRVEYSENRPAIGPDSSCGFAQIDIRYVHRRLSHVPSAYRFLTIVFAFSE
jgi:hypothetical protein